MSNQIKRIRYKTRRQPVEVGAKPGSINISADALKPVIMIYSYNEHELVSSEGKTL